MDKFLTDQNILKVVKEIKKNHKIVLCHGIFDLLHVGHIEYFEEAKKNGDILIVSLTEDKFINKGPNRPHFNNANRLKSISALSIVDYVYLNKSFTANSIIRLIKPDFYVKGPDYKNTKDDLTKNINKEISEVKKYGGKYVVTKGQTYSSSNIINSSFSELSESQSKLLKIIKIKYKTFDKIKLKIEELLKKKILIIGEAIIDNYIFCEALGKASKDLHINIKKLNEEMYLGGTLSIAKNLSDYCNNISLLSFIGRKKEHLGFIKKNLNKNIHTNFLTKSNSSTILKTRYLDDIDKIKFIGVYDFNDSEINKIEEKKFINLIKNKGNKSDLIIITDYNHGIITTKVSEFISSKFKHRFNLNCQLNSSNMRFKALDKYKYPNLVIINETELRYEFRDKETKIETLAKRLIYKLKINHLLITSGRRGMTYFKKSSNKKIHLDAFSDYAVDKVGAGDTVLAFFSIFFNFNFGIELSMLLSSLAARHSVRNIANKNSYLKKDMLTHLHYLLK